jgi:hypothetical protein
VEKGTGMLVGVVAALAAATDLSAAAGTDVLTSV